MSGFDYISLIKRQAKALSKTKEIKLSAAQADIATGGGFDHYHELQKVASKNPDDIRLMRLALQIDDLREVIYTETKIYDHIDYMLESELSATIAETNAEGFCVSDLTVNKADYDQDIGVLSIHAEIIYAGDQKPDRPYSGTEFYLDVVIRLYRHVDHWEMLDTEGGLEIVEIESDQDRDWEQQSETDSVEKLASTVNALETANILPVMPDFSAIEAAELLPDVSRFTGAIEAAERFNETFTATGAVEKAMRSGMFGVDK